MNLRRWLLCAAGVMGLACPSMYAAGPVSIGLTADYFSKYIWRGQNLNDESSLQPSISAGAYGVTGSVWGSFDLTDENGHDKKCTEVDLTLDYTAAVPGVKGLDFSVGGIHYQFPNTDFDSTTEVYGGLSWNVWLSPFVKVFYDMDVIEGAYLQVGIGHTQEKVVTWKDDCYCNVQVGASIGYGTASYNKGYFGVDSSELNDLTLTAAVPVCLGSWTVKPSVGYSAMLNDDIQDATVHSDNLWAGVSLAKTF